MSGPPSHRTCKKCEETKPLETFSKDPTYKWGYRYICKACKEAQRDKGTQEHQELVSARVLSLGAGVQSSALHMMSEVGLLPRLNFSVYADTGWEPQHVYEQVDWLEKNSSIPILRVSNGNLREEMIDGQFATMPIIAFREDGTQSILSRQCTARYKVKPIRSQLMKSIRGQYRTVKIYQWLGISADEAHRMKDSRTQYIEHVYPLVDMGWTRDDCEKWWNEQGYPPFKRSACIGCPFHSDRDWMELSPEEFADAVSFEKEIQEALKGKIDGQVYLHQSGKPLDQVTFNPRIGKADLFGSECEGMCGI